MTDRRPVLFVTNHAPAFRVGAFAALHARQDVVFALIGGDVRVVHLGTDLPPAASERHPETLVTVAHLVARKRHADV
ncbi:MAG TPA: hypothetical protein VE526_01790, partial [Solirubrobacteraceae bacterium]|nr:hypothetical protein [Solirubrobacteraceae bacterium]